MVNNFTNIKERIVYLIENKKINKEKFFNKIGATSANFRGVAIKSHLNSDTIAKIIAEMPDIDLHWLITGKYKNDKIFTNENIIQEERASYGLSELELKIKEQERIIEDLRSLISYQKDHIQTLEKKSAVNTAIKNSA